MALSGGTRLGPYEITGQIGAGGMGEVYRATDAKLGRDVAIKTLPAALAADKDRLARFEREAKLLAALNHQHIASVYSLDEHEGTIYIAMELVDGETLEEKLKAGALPVDGALRLGLQIAEALEAAHDKGVVHRDLKPANVMITADDQVKVLDFGLAKAFSDAPQEASPAHSPALSLAMTQQGIVLGTAGYMSPEQASGQATDRRADIWAFGVVLYEMLTGLPLFSGESVPHILADVLRAEPDWQRLPKNLHPRIQELLERCLEKRPRSRYAGIGDARVDIEAALNDPRGVTPAPVETAAASARARGIDPVAAAGIAVTVAAIAALTAWFLWPPPAPRPVTTFSHVLPGEQALRSPAVKTLAVSPGGRRFVYNTTAGFYLRNMDQLTALPIPGTEEPKALPFFSPDGQSIGYFVPGLQGIEAIAISGGASVPVSEFFDIPLGASWGDDGTIFFGQPDGIYRVAATGGEPRLVIPAEEGTTYYGPSLLPDGDSLLFSVSAFGDWDAGEIVVESLSTGDRKPLQSGGNDATYVPTGHIVYAFEDSLYGVAFDIDTLSVSGGPVPLVQGVARAGTSGAANYGIAANGTLVYIAGSVAAGSRALVWVDRNGSEERIPIDASNYVYPRMSPDHRRVALDDRNADDDIWIWDFGNETLTRLTDGDGGAQYPAWDADRGRIAFVRANSAEILWRAANDTGTTEQLMAADDVDFNGASPYFFSPGGAELVFRAIGTANGNDIAMISVDGDGEPVWLLSGSSDERNAELSPDGRWMAYQSNQSGRFEVYVRPFPNVDDGLTQVSNNGGEFPLWSPDGSELFYLEPGPPARLMGVTESESAETEFAFVGRAEVIEWEYFAAGSPAGRPYDISADGQRFLAISEGGTDGSSVEIIVIENWTEDLKRQVPTGR